ncbi:MAG: hypothetical protein M1136_11635 [Chloroflexi bacterium]|nr:hypothetical protein [Chloroflexota bacterium]MCL5076274.1 hypothetical protein [Chloroflexota bacterium]
MRKRYEREIEEILSKIPDFLPAEPRRQRIRRVLRRLLSRAQVALIKAKNSPTSLLIGSFGFALLGYILRHLAPSLAFYSGLFSLLLFLTAIIATLIWQRPHYEQRWRGRVIEWPKQVSWWKRFWRELRTKIHYWTRK